MTDREKIIAEIERLKNWEPINITQEQIRKLVQRARLGVLIGLEEFINSLPAEQPSEEVNKEIDRFIADKVGKTITVGQVAHYFAKWQKEQIIKSAIDGCWIKRNRYTKENVLNGFSVTCEAIQKFKDGDKVKVIIIKEAEQ